MKIYTKTGDSGTTALIGGTRVPKDSPRVEAYGDVDELTAWFGVIRSQIEQNDFFDNTLKTIQERLMVCAALLAADETADKKLPSITSFDIQLLEKLIDEAQSELPPLKSFVLPAPPAVAAMCHVARCVARRAERSAVRVSHTSPVDENVLAYLNRLSDYLFVLSRQLTANSGIADDCWLP